MLQTLRLKVMKLDYFWNKERMALRAPIYNNDNRAENFRIVDIEINAWSSGFTKPEIRLIHIRYPRKKFKIQPIRVSCSDALLNFLKTGFYFLRISVVDGVISIEPNIDWTNVSFGLMFIKTNVQKDFSPQMW